MNKLTKELVIKSLAVGAAASCVVLIKGIFSSEGEKDFVTVDLNKIID